MRFRIKHPTRQDIYAMAGVDHAVGPYWVEVFREGRSRPIKSLDVFTRGKPVTLQEALAFLIAETFFSEAQLHAALVWLQDGGTTPRDMRVVEIVRAFKHAD